MKMKLDKLAEIVSDEIGLDLRSRCRDANHVMARTIYFDLAYNKFKLGSLKQVGNAVGRDHATVIHCLNNIFPHMKMYYKEMELHYKNLLSYLSEYFNNRQDVDSYENASAKLYNDYLKLKHKFEELNMPENDTIRQMVSSMKNLSEDKLSKLKVRVDAIIPML